MENFFTGRVADQLISSYMNNIKCISKEEEEQLFVRNEKVDPVYSRIEFSFEYCWQGEHDYEFADYDETIEFLAKSGMVIL